MGACITFSGEVWATLIGRAAVVNLLFSPPAQRYPRWLFVGEVHTHCPSLSSWVFFLNDKGTCRG